MTIKLQLNTISIAIALSLGTIVSAHAAGSREAEALDKATIQLVQATQIAEKQESGKTIKAEFDIEKDKPLWEVKVLSKGGLKEYKIDASSGVVVKVEDEHIRGKLTNFVTGINLKDLDGAKTTLVQAIGTAEKKFNGKVVKVEVEHERGNIQYEIFVRAADKTEKVKIDASTGQPRS